MAAGIRLRSSKCYVNHIIFRRAAVNRYIKFTESFGTCCSWKRRQREMKRRRRTSRRASTYIMQEWQLSWRAAYLDIKIQKELFSSLSLSSLNSRDVTVYATCNSCFNNQRHFHRGWHLYISIHEYFPKQCLLIGLPAVCTVKLELNIKYKNKILTLQLKMVQFLFYFAMSPSLSLFFLSIYLILLLFLFLSFFLQPTELQLWSFGWWQ